MGRNGPHGPTVSAIPWLGQKSPKSLGTSFSSGDLAFVVMAKEVLCVCVCVFTNTPGLRSVSHPGTKEARIPQIILVGHSGGV